MDISKCDRYNYPNQSLCMTTKNVRMCLLLITTTVRSSDGYITEGTIASIQPCNLQYNWTMSHNACTLVNLISDPYACACCTIKNVVYRKCLLIFRDYVEICNSSVDGFTQHVSYYLLHH